jgi:hypothetical protein
LLPVHKQGLAVRVLLLQGCEENKSSCPSIAVLIGFLGFSKCLVMWYDWTLQLPLGNEVISPVCTEQLSQG